MNQSEKPSIWKRSRQLDNDRRKKTQELMEEYDRTVYYPAKKALQEECEKGPGHHGNNYHDNGLGWHWFYCQSCGARYNIEQHTKYVSEEDDDE